MANYDYFNQYKSEMERIKVKTAHDEHKVEFQQMCAKMISDAIPEIKAQVKQEIMAELKEKEQDVSFTFSMEDAARKLKDALSRIFK